MTVYIYGMIGSKYDGDGNTEEKLRAQLAEENGDEVVVAINSPGGDLFKGLAIMNILRRHDARIVAEVDGLAASAASVIAMGADEVRMPESSMLMIHNPWGIAVGDFQEMRDTADDFEKVRDSMLAVYRAKTGLDDEELKSMLDDETWLSAGEAKKKGFADTITKEDDETQAHVAMQIAACDLSKFDQVPDEIAKMASIGRHKIAAMAKRPAASPQPGADMKTAKKKEGESTSAPQAEAQPAPQADVDAIAEQARQEGMKAELNRQKDIKAVCAKVGLDGDDVQAIIDKGESVEASKDLVIDALAARDHAKKISAHRPAITVGEDSDDKFKAGMADGIRMRASSIDMDHGNPFRGRSLLRHAEACIVRAGGKVPATKREIYAAAINISAASTGAHTTSLFPEILKDVMHKEVLRGWEEAPNYWDQIASQGSLSDFRERHMVSLNVFDNLDEVGEGEEYRQGSVGERGEQISLGKYGKLFALTFEAMVNDDTRQLTRAPAMMGRAASRVPDKIAFEVLTSNPELSSGTTLFHADHSNTRADVFSHAAVVAMRTAMRTQTVTTKDGDEEPLDIIPAKLVVPVALDDDARSLMSSEKIDADLQNNTLRGAFEVVSSPRLDLSSTTEFYLIADPAVYDVIEVAFLDGNAAPELFQEEAWNVDQTEFKVRLNCGAAPLDYRAMQRGADGS